MSVEVDRFSRLLPVSYERAYEGVTISEEVMLILDVAPASFSEVETIAAYTTGSAHPVNSQSILDNFEIEAISPTQYKINLDYVPRNTSRTEGGATPQTKVFFNTWYTTRVAEFDTITPTLAVANSAKDAPNPLPSIQIPHDEIVIVKRQSSFDLTRTKDKGKVNTSAFTLVGISIPANCAMLSEYRFDVVYDDLGNVEYDVTYAFKTNFKENVSGTVIGFKLEILDAGYNKLVAGVSTPIRSNKTKTLPVEPVRLDGAGAVLATASASVYYERLIHERADFGSCGLDTTWPY